MKTKKRWIKSAIETAAKSEVQFPWARGARREQMIAARKDQPQQRRCA